MSSFTYKTLLAAIAGAASVAAHGHVSSVTVAGKSFPGFTPFNGVNAPAGTVGWSTTASDNGFVLPDAFSSSDIACHKGGKNAQSSVTIAAGSSMTVQWDTWPESHKGPVIDYMASCGTAGCETVAISALQFFKIDEAGLENGVWASDKLIADGNKWEVTVPASIKAGSYVLRHEMIGLHEGNRANGAQMYPQCINLEVTGSGTEVPAGVAATSLYKATDAGILFDIYNNPTSYPIPGPAVFSAGSSGNTGNTGNTGGNTATTTTKAASASATATAASTATATAASDCLARRSERAARRAKARREASA